MGAISPAAVLAVLYNVFVAISFGTYLWFRIVQLLPANVSAICTLMSPVVGVFAGNLALGERLGGSELAALDLDSVDQIHAVGGSPQAKPSDRDLV